MLNKRIVALRKSYSLTQDGLADKMHISRSRLSQYELGTRQPDNEMLQKFADFFDVSTDYLLGRTDQPNQKSKTEDFDDPELGMWFKELKEASPERREELKQFWDFIKIKEKDRKPGDKQRE